MPLDRVVIVSGVFTVTSSVPVQRRGAKILFLGSKYISPLEIVVKRMLSHNVLESWK